MKKFICLLFLFGGVVFAGGTENDIYADADVRPGDPELEEQSIDFVDETLGHIKDWEYELKQYARSQGSSLDSYRYVRIEDEESIEDIKNSFSEKYGEDLPLEAFSVEASLGLDFETGDVILLNEEGNLEVLDASVIALPKENISKEQEQDILKEESVSTGSSSSLPSLSEKESTTQDELVKKILLIVVGSILLVTFFRMFRPEKKK